LTDEAAETHRSDVQDVGYEICVERRGWSAGVVDAGVPPIVLVDWEDRDTLLAVADGACGLVRPEPPVPVEHLIFRGLPAGVELGEDGVILWEPRPGGRERGFVYDTTVVARVPAGAGRGDITVVGVIDREFSRRQTRCP
jgi:hypothetical protein